MNLLEDRGHKLKILTYAIVLAIALYGVSQEDVSLNSTSSFQALMIDIFAPVQASVVYVKRTITSVLDDYLINVFASKENKLLRKDILKLKNKIFQYEELVKENDRLKSLLEFGKNVPYRKVLAQIVGWDSSSDFKVLRVNKGLEDGIRLQSAVVTSDGLVGYVVRLTNNFADILTILDHNNRVDAIVSRTRSNGIVEGYATEKCLMKYLTRTEPVILNDLVLTSGLGNIYPKGIKIGTVSKIERESYGITQHVEIRPSVDFRRLEELIIMVFEDENDKKKEWEILDKSDS